jgi:uncharacterized protein YjiS (DUF1127 family)
MSVISTNRTAPVGATSIFAAALSAFASWNDARVTRKTLAQLSDRELDDIGLCRGDIEAIASAR